jgi:hypothetical protein
LIAFSGRAKFPMYRDIAPVARRRAVVCRAPLAARRSIARAAVAAAIATVRVFVRSVDPRVVVAFAVRASVVLQTRRSRRFVAYRGASRAIFIFFSTKARLGFRV